MRSRANEFAFRLKPVVQFPPGVTAFFRSFIPKVARAGGFLDGLRVDFEFHHFPYEQSVRFREGGEGRIS